VVWDSDPIGRDYIGQRTIPIQFLQSGYRHIQLKDTDGASIFVKITKDSTHKVQSKQKRESKLDKLHQRMKSSRKLFDSKSKRLYKNSRASSNGSDRRVFNKKDSEKSSHSCASEKDVIKFCQKCNYSTWKNFKSKGKTFLNSDSINEDQIASFNCTKKPNDNIFQQSSFSSSCSCNNLKSSLVVCPTKTED